MKRLDQALLDNLAHQAACSPRLRYAAPWHASTDRVQRVLIALQPGTYIRPHRHPQMPGLQRFEFLLVVQGEIGLMLFDEHGSIVQTERLGSVQPLRGIEVAEAAYHTVVALVPDTICLEIKEGGYEARRDKDFLEVFPEENTPAARQLVACWQHQWAAARCASATRTGPCLCPEEQARKPSVHPSSI
jgi:cupin fold WbuC family metalloprotein